MPGSSEQRSRSAASFFLPLAWALAVTLWFEPSEIVIRRDPVLQAISEKLSQQSDTQPQEDAASLIDVGPGKRLVSGAIEKSFAASADDAQIPAAVVDQFVDLLSERVEFRRDIRRGATFSIMYAEPDASDLKSARSGTLLAASLRNNGQTMAAIRYDDGRGKIAYYDETGMLLGRQFLRYPLKFSRISSAFSQARFHPTLQRSRPHNGVDFAAPTGTPVRAVADGVITIAGSRGEAGTMLRISHGDRYSSAYLHLNSIARGLQTGARVRRGQLIGTVGMTGAATGPHLHFSLFDRDLYINPLKAKLNFVTPNGEKLPSDLLQLALQQLEAGFTQLAQNASASRQS